MWPPLKQYLKFNDLKLFNLGFPLLHKLRMKLLESVNFLGRPVSCCIVLKLPCLQCRRSRYKRPMVGHAKDLPTIALLNPALIFKVLEAATSRV